MSSSRTRVYGIVLQRWLNVRRAAGINITESWNRLAQPAKPHYKAHVTSKGSRVHRTYTTTCRPFGDCFRQFESHFPTEQLLPRLVFTPSSITMATATPTSRTGMTVATNTPTISTAPAFTYKGCPTPMWLPTEMEAGSVLKKRRRKMNQHKYKKWRKKHRFLRRRLKK